jgi:hypothetical protein
LGGGGGGVGTPFGGSPNLLLAETIPVLPITNAVIAIATKVALMSLFNRVFILVGLKCVNKYPFTI